MQQEINIKVVAQDRAKDNDFKQLFLEMYPRLVRYAVSLLGDGNEARDVVGDVFEKAWNQFSSLQMETRRSWLYASVRNACLNWLKHQQVEQTNVEALIEATRYDMSTRYEEHERLLQQAERIARELKEPTCTILRLCYFEHLTYQQAADSRQAGHQSQHREEAYFQGTRHFARANEAYKHRELGGKIMNKNQDQELDYRMDSVSENVSENASGKVSENVSDARLSQIFGEALGDEPSKEETLAAWEAFEQKHISSEEEHLQKAEDELSEKKIDKARILTWITASVAVAASLFLFIFRSSQEISQPTEFSMELFSEVTSPKQVEQTLSNGYCVVSTPAATTTLVTLSDGTRVMLNANSTLEYPASFDDAEVREVRLKGEAHFEVTKNPHRPFVVKAGEMQTQVLGTIFDVKAYRKDAPKVTLMEGKVKVSNADTEIEMRPGQTATLQADKIVVSKASSSASDWLEGDFDMDQVTLAEAMSDIGAWYNKTVVFQSQANMDKLIHFRFSRRASLQEIITALNEMGVAKVRIEKGKIMVL